ncbi:MAG TPA: hypothetical protein VMT24_07385 [Aggregatilineaceae bacterium]|nr:hypothetical protein [Aggregatilineaceae bacterium]
MSLVPAVMTILVERAFSFYTVAPIRFIAQQTCPQETRTVLALYTVTLASLIGIVAPPFAGPPMTVLVRAGCTP